MPQTSDSARSCLSDGFISDGHLACQRVGPCLIPGVGRAEGAARDERQAALFAQARARTQKAL